MKKITFLLFISFIDNLYSQIVTIPDATFKESLVKYKYFDTNNQELSLDANGDGEIQISEAQVLQVLNIQNGTGEIKDITGIETFTALKEFNCPGHKIEAADFSKNVMLEKLQLQHNRITDLDISKNVKLTDLSLSYNLLAVIDISNNTLLKTITLDNNFILNIDFTKNTKLISIDVAHNKLTHIDVTTLVNLTELRAGNTANYNGTQINRFDSIDLSKNILLEIFEAIDVKLATLDVSKNTVLKTVKISHNDIEELNFTKNIHLESLECFNNKLNSLNVKNGFNIDKLKQLHTLNNPNLIYICVDNVAHANNLLSFNAFTKDNHTTYTNNCTLSNKEFDFDSTILIYPNPFNNRISIENTSPKKILKVEIFNNIGGKVLETREKIIKTNNLSSGIYFAKISLENDKIIHKKIIKN